MCSWSRPISTLILGVFPLHQIAHGGVNVSRDLKLLEIIFEVFQTVWKTYLNVTDRRTDGRTDDMQSHNRAMLVVGRQYYNFLQYIDLISYTPLSLRIAHEE